MLKHALFLVKHVYVLFLEACLEYTALANGPLSPRCLQNINVRKQKIYTATFQPCIVIPSRTEDRDVSRCGRAVVKGATRAVPVRSTRHVDGTDRQFTSLNMAT